MTRPALWSTRLSRAKNVTLTKARSSVGLTESAPRCTPSRPCIEGCRCFAEVKDDTSLSSRQIWFNSSAPRTTALQGGPDHKRENERTLRLGKTVRTLHERLPTLLKEPLPSDLLSPQISLHLFPSTHPHLPTVSGRIAYVAALWTAPVAWGRVPLVGNVQLSILSERMVRNGGLRMDHEGGDEKLIVKWKTCGKTKHRDGTGGIYRGVGIAVKDPVDKIKEFIAGTAGRSGEADAEPEEFCGIFIFEFDDQGRIAKHVIEHTEEGGHFDRMTRVVSVTDWLIGTFNGKRKQEPALAWYAQKSPNGELKFLNGRRRE